MTASHRKPARLTPSTPLTYHLGAAHYRRSELPWGEAGRPVAEVTLALDGDALVVDVELRKSDPLALAPASAENELDNEHPDINGDGVQIHLSPPGVDADQDDARWHWLVVPQPGAQPSARVSAHGAGALPLDATARQIAGGYAVRCRVRLPDTLRPRPGREVPILLDVLVNEMPLWRERRRGQLVLSGGCDETVFLRGDRQPAARLLPFLLVDG